MSNRIYTVGNLVRVTSYGPFRGLKGTIQTVDRIADSLEEAFCFYLIDLEGVTIPAPIWFESQEIEFIDAPSVVLQAQQELTGALR
jgi:flavodoxin